MIRLSPRSCSAILISAASLVIILFFQNCSQVGFTNLASSLKSNNGELYGGKPTGYFYRFIPDYTCEQKVSPTASLSISSSDMTLTENKKLLCGAVPQNVDPTLIDWSIYQREIVGYQEGIFSEGLPAFTSIPANLVEVWCRDRNDEQGIETITHYDRTTNSAVNRIYYAIPNLDGSYVNSLISDFSVARIVGQKTVIVKNDQGFELIVHRDQPAPKFGLFMAHLNALVEGKKVSRETYCRLGGALDPKVWPAQQIVDFNTNIFKVSPDLNSFAYAVGFSLMPNIRDLYVSDMSGLSQKKINPNGSRLSSESFEFTGDSQSLVYQTYPISTLPNWSSIFISGDIIKTDLKGTSSISVSKTTTVISDRFRLSSDGKFIVFAELPEDSNKRNSSLYSARVDGGELINLSSSIGANAFGFYILGSQNKIVFQSTGAFYSIDLDGTGLLKMPLPALPSVNWSFDVPLLTGAENEQNVILNARNRMTQESQLYSVVIADGRSISLPLNLDVKLMSSSKLHALLSPYSFAGVETDRAALTLANLQTGVNFKLPPMKAIPDFMTLTELYFSYGNNCVYSGLWNCLKYPAQVFFNQKSSVLIGPQILADGNLKAVAISTADGSIKDLCPGILSSQLLIQEAVMDQFVIVTFDPTTLLLNVYRKDSVSSCHKINSTLSAVSGGQQRVNYFLISPDNNRIIVLLESSSDNFSDGSLSSQLLYIPLDGQPAFRVDTPVDGKARIHDFFFSKDSQSVIYNGNQIGLGDFNFYLWKIPHGQ